MELLNKTKRPLTVPLPGGKKLFLGPGRTGQVASKAADHPPLKALVDAGDIEILDSGKTKPSGGGLQGGSSGGRIGTGGVRHTGDG